MNKSRSWLRVAGVASVLGVLALAVGGCNATDVKVTGKDLDAAEKKMEGPTQRTTRYDTSLHRLGEMLKAYNVPTVKVQTKAILNATAGEGVPKDLAPMVTTALNKIGGSIQFIPYDPTYVFTEKELGEKLDRTLPDVVVQGAITEFDKELVERKRAVEGDVLFGQGKGETNIRAGIEGDAAGGRVALDLQVIAYRTQKMITGVQTSNRINVLKRENSNNLDVAIYGNGLGVKTGFAEKDGIHAALRLLVEISVLELVGKYCDIPYWRCVDGAPPDEEIIKAYRLNLEDDPGAMARLKLFAFCHGEEINLQSLEFSPAEKAMVEKLKLQYGVTNDLDLITKLWASVPIEQSVTRLRNYRRHLASMAVEAEKNAVAKTATGAPASSSAQPAATVAKSGAPVAGRNDVVAPLPVELKAAPKKFGKLSDADF
ncbi:MAG: hypothetical protein WCH61_02345 [bacterium]